MSTCRLNWFCTDALACLQHFESGRNHQSSDFGADDSLCTATTVITFLSSIIFLLWSNHKDWHGAHHIVNAIDIPMNPLDMCVLDLELDLNLNLDLNVDPDLDLDPDLNLNHDLDIDIDLHKCSAIPQSFHTFQPRGVIYLYYFLLYGITHCRLQNTCSNKIRYGANLGCNWSNHTRALHISFWQCSKTSLFFFPNDLLWANTYGWTAMGRYWTYPNRSSILHDAGLWTIEEYIKRQKIWSWST